MNMKTLVWAAMFAAAFAAGLGANRIFAVATAASAPPAPQLINVGDVKPSELVAPRPGLAPEKVIARTDAALLKVQMGAPNKHYHTDSDEIMYVVEGTGAAWFVDKSISVKPGDLLFIPKGTAHGAFTEGVKVVTVQIPATSPANTVNLP